LLSAIRLDVIELVPVYSRCTSIGFAAEIRKLQHVLSMNLVIQRVEPKPEFSFAFACNAVCSF
jgi:hypothetical protein